MRIFYAFLIIICVSCNSSTSKSNLTIEDQRYIDSVCQYYEGRNQTTEEFNFIFNSRLKKMIVCEDTVSLYYLNLITSHCISHSLPSSKDLIFQLKSKSLKYNDTLNYARSLRLEAAFYLKLGDKIKALELFDKALRVFEYLNYDFEKVKCYNGIGYSLHNLDDYSGSEYFFNKALFINKNTNLELKIKSIKGLVLSYVVSIQSGKAIELIEYYLKEREVKLKASDKIYFKYLLALACEDKKEFQKSLNIVNELTKANEFDGLIGSYKINIDRLQLRLLRHLNKNVSYVSQYEKIESQLNGDFYNSQRSSLLVDYINHLYEIGKYDKAFVKANEAYTLATKTNNTLNRLNSLVVLAKVDKKNSLSYFKKFDLINDKLAKTKQNVFTKILIDTQEVDRARESAEKQKKIILFSTICIIMILLLLYATYRNRVISLKYDLNKKHQKSSELIQELIVQNQAIEVEARQNEQRRIAMEIHDNVLNQLASVRYKLFKLNFSQDTNAVVDALQGVENIRQVEVELRNLTHNLTHQSQNENISIRQMISQLVTVHEEIYSQKIKLYMDDWNWEGLSSEVKLCFVRIVQEALFNCAKHARAQNIEIDFNYTKDFLVVQIKDDGKGFNIQGNHSGIGLQNLAIRAAQIQALLHIQSEKKQGTVIKIEKKIN